MAEVKIPENEPFRQNRDFRRFGENFALDLLGGLNFGGNDLNFFLY